MDETSLRAQLDLAVSDEPPLGHLVGNSVRAGRRIRRRRRAAGAASLSAAAIVVVSVVPALTAGAGHRASSSGPAAAEHPAPARTAYVYLGSGTVVPISLATNVPGTPIKVPGGGGDGGLDVTPAAATPNGRTIYELGAGNDGGTVTAIDTATNTAGRTITLPNFQPIDIAIAPNGKTAYVGGEEDVVPINLATNTADKPIRIPTRSWAMAFTPDGKTLYVLNPFERSVTPISTATNTALAPIRLTVPKTAFGYLFDIAVTPNGKTAYVLYGVQGGRPYANWVIPINLATNTALGPIEIQTPGLASGLVIAHGGRTAYVLSTRAVTPIDTTTNQAEPAIDLPANAGNAYSIALAPDGKMMYALSPRGVVPIRTASRTVLPMINVPKIQPATEIAISPDGKTIYVGAFIHRLPAQHGITLHSGGGVVPISTATNTAGQVINLGASPAAVTFGR
jgi:DNA-binding beta-propeller fold protein YncE